MSVSHWIRIQICMMVVWNIVKKKQHVNLWTKTFQDALENGVDTKVYCIMSECWSDMWSLLTEQSLFACCKIVAVLDIYSIFMLHTLSASVDISSLKYQVIDFDSARVVSSWGQGTAISCTLCGRLCLCLARLFCFYTPHVVLLACISAHTCTSKAWYLSCLIYQWHPSEWKKMFCLNKSNVMNWVCACKVTKMSRLLPAQ